MNNSRSENVGAPSQSLAQAALGSNNHQPAYSQRQRRQEAPNSFAAVIAGFLLCALQCTAQPQAQEFQYYTNDGAICITRYIGPGGDVTIPSSIEGLPVTGVSGFRSCTNVTSVVIPNSVTFIAEDAFFGCTALSQVTIGNGVTSIDNGAFFDCIGLTTVYIPSSVIRIGQGYGDYFTYGLPAFAGCTNLTAIDVDPGNDTYSSAEGVLFNKSQTELMSYPHGRIGSYIIPESVESIGENAFHNADNLTSVTFGNNVTNIASSAFGGCWNLSELTLGNKVLTIGTYAFAFCYGLTNVTIPDSVTHLRSGAFAWCTSLRSVNIPRGVTEIETGDGHASSWWEPAFGFCSNLASITVDPLNSKYASGDGVLFNKSQTRLVAYPPGRTGSYVIPDTVQIVGLNAFATSTGLDGVTIGNNVTNIERFAFYRCTRLTNIIMSDLVSTIGMFAFANCSRLTAIKLSAGITRMHEGLFKNCSLLTKVIIPHAVTSIGELSFYGCSSLNDVTIGNGVKSIESVAFANCARLTNLYIPESVDYIAPFAFVDSVNLTAIYFRGNAPRVALFNFEPDYFPRGVMIYYLPDRAGWGPSLASRRTALWLPRIHSAKVQREAGTDAFYFTVNWASGQTVAIEACPSLTSPSWVPLQTNVLAGDSHRFSDPEWTSYPARYYRLTTLQGN
jgi:hypothetical protein